MKAHWLLATAFFAAVSLAGCASIDATGQPNTSNPAPMPVAVPVRTVAITGGTASWSDSAPLQLTVRYDNGGGFDIDHVHRLQTVSADDAVTLMSRSDAAESSKMSIASLDGRPVLDAELWTLRRPVAKPVGPAFLGATRTSNQTFYQGCRDGKIYSASSLTALMGELAGEMPEPGSSDGATVTALADERLPVCNWRHRTGLDSVLPAPAYVAHMKAVPAYEDHLGHIDFTQADGSVHIYFDTARRLKKIETDVKHHSIVLQTPEGDTDCDRLDKCTRAEIIVDQKKVAIESLDERPMFQSRLYRSRDASGAKHFYACQGGKLFVTKSEASAENELKIAEENPDLQRDHKGPPIDFKSAMTTESGAVVIPDLFCDWDYRAQHMKKLRASSQRK